ncbi:unnamed protein product [Rotaria sordida]|uniref:Uncharacterized protein n=1 Tax=Rotaria sordida TaxID=392033 RepID=A0A815HP86_9BILA|nr:unnamed protein product [Rotaria sordida]CAF1603999.1 unnamed protein product [Rotaria sordida]
MFSSVDDLAKTHVTDIVVLDTLREKELCELTQLTDLQSMLNKEDFNRSDQNMIDKLERPRKRLTEFMFKIVQISLYF